MTWRVLNIRNVHSHRLYIESGRLIACCRGRCERVFLTVCFYHYWLILFLCASPPSQIFSPLSCSHLCHPLVGSGGGRLERMAVKLCPSLKKKKHEDLREENIGFLDDCWDATDEHTCIWHLPNTRMRPAGLIRGALVKPLILPYTLLCNTNPHTGSTNTTIMQVSVMNENVT